MESQPNRRRTAPPECTASSDPTTLPIGAYDAQGEGGHVDIFLFDNTSSFVDNTLHSNDSIVVPAEKEMTLTLPQPAPSIYEPQSTSHLIASNTDDASFHLDGEGDWVALLDELSHVSEKPPTPPPPATHKDKRQELEYLRAQVVELESELDQLRSPFESPSESEEPSVWKQVATRQSEAKQKAIVENVKLRKMLEGQLKVARSLEKLVYKRALSDPDSHIFTKRTRFSTIQDRDVDAERAEIRGRIHKLLDTVDAVMDESGLSLFYTAMEDARATTSATANNAVCMEMVVVRVLPFPLEQVAQVQWQCTTADHIEFENGSFGASRRSESKCDVQYTAQIQLRRAEAVLHVDGVSARRTEEHRTLIVFEAVGTTRGSLFADSPIHCREQTFFLLERNLQTTETEEPSTVVKVCVRLWPENVEATENIVVKSFIDLVIGCYNENVMTVMQLVENTLLEQSLGKQSAFLE